MHCILTINVNKCPGKKTTRRKKMPNPLLGNVFQLPSRRIPRRWTRSGTNLVIFSEALSLRASSPLWASEASLARTRLGPSLARSREAHFACPNRRACSQAKKPFEGKLIYSGAKWRFIEQYVYWNLIQDKKIFELWRNILNAHCYKYVKKVVYQSDFLKMNLLHKSKMKCFTCRCCLRTWSK